jgi:hypothetical protein
MSDSYELCALDASSKRLPCRLRKSIDIVRLVCNKKSKSNNFPYEEDSITHPYAFQPLLLSTLKIQYLKLLR